MPVDNVLSMIVSRDEIFQRWPFFSVFDSSKLKLLKQESMTLLEYSLREYVVAKRQNFVHFKAGETA